jgi:hypothetical protein
VKAFFYCRDCGEERSLDNPISVEFLCGCGGMLRMQNTSTPKNRKELDAEPCVPGGGTMMDLIGGTKGGWWNKPKAVLRRYKVCTCRSCGRVSITEAKRFLTCRLCKKRHEFRKNGEWNLRMKDFDSHEEAREYLLELTSQRRSTKDGRQ